MKKEIILENISLKNILKKFNYNEEFVYLSLGDTNYKNFGFIDESIFEGNKIKNILDFEYDFEGLVHFEGILKSGIKIDLIGDNSFKVIGDEKQIFKILIN